ncbi:MAG: AAA family ATPase [Alphaproteobacteria bacterium]|jgi:superfamily I DNA and/or RNA helicase|nr:AAA family ATPase [Alphaproteobacteria bacterium]
MEIFVKGKNRTKDVKSYSLKNNKFHITFNDGKTYSYNPENVEIITSVLDDKLSKNCFEYLKAIADEVGIKDEGNNILSKSYSKIDSVSKDSILSAFLSGKPLQGNLSQKIIPVFPFGFNLSQKKAVDKALHNNLSIIEGPPGTGKTQTILNIIANLVMQNKSIAVVSSNNSATNNIFEKLKKHNVDFISATLGNEENKQKFIAEQKPLPSLLAYEITEIEAVKIKSALQSLSNNLEEILLKKNELAKAQQELENILVEYQHFKEYCQLNDDYTFYLKPINTDTALTLWLCCEKYIYKKPNFFVKIYNKFYRGVKNKQFYSLSGKVMISLAQQSYYNLKIKELGDRALQLQVALKDFNFKAKMAEYSTLSQRLFHNFLAKKYKDTNKDFFKLDDLWQSSKKILQRYPVILSTTYSLSRSLSHKTMYDYVIIDEASQVDLATGTLALCYAKNVVIVGDLKQLPNVVNYNTALATDLIFKKFNLKEEYRYKNHSLLSSMIELFPDSPKTLLVEHYRCHPKIIEFCNQKFYNNQLIVLTDEKSNLSPLVLYKTVKGNHAREDHINQRQIDVIKNEVIPQQKVMASNSVGIVSPYRNQTNALQEAFFNTTIQADTVDKFQGRENEVIILCTVDNKISQFTDNPNRLNVAVSRAINQLIVVINDTELDATNMGDLVNYIKYNNLEVINSEVYSVFDYLYKDYYSKRVEILKKQKRISQYDSENLMLMLINDIIKEDRFNKFGVSAFIPLKMILRDTEKLNEEEKKYTNNMLTHVDFLIFDKLGKTPKLAIEVDGVAYHKKGSTQEKRDNLKNVILEKYNIPLIRLKTNGSGEKEQLVLKLEEALG